MVSRLAPRAANNSVSGANRVSKLTSDLSATTVRELAVTVASHVRPRIARAPRRSSAFGIDEELPVNAL